MRTFPLGVVIAERQVVLRPRDGTSRDAMIRVGQPVLDPAGDGRVWVCPFQIAGLGDDRVVGIFGVDSLQALLLAVHTVPAELAVLARDADGVILHHGHPDTTLLSGCRTALRYAGNTFPSSDEGDAG